MLFKLPDPSNAPHNVKIIKSFKPKYLLNVGRIINNPVVTKTLKLKKKPLVYDLIGFLKHMFLIFNHPL